MRYLKNVIKALGYVLIITLVLTFIITIISYFNILGDGVVKTLKLFTTIISIFVGGFLMGSKANKKGFMEGFKFGIIVSVILIIISLICHNLKIESILFYTILTISSIFGSIVGIQKKLNK